MGSARLDRDRFREFFRTLPSGVTIVTTVDSTGAPKGFTASSFTSVSIDPPLVLVCVDGQSLSLPAILDRGLFTVNVLGGGAQGEELALCFAGKDRGRRFESGTWTRSPAGHPISPLAVAWMDCRLRNPVEAGDHVVLIGEFLEAGTPGGVPLVWHGGAFRRLSPAEPG